jgi:hypothetical protein
MDSEICCRFHIPFQQILTAETQANEVEVVT